MIGTITDHIGPVQKPLVNGDTTDDPQPTFTGNNARPGDIITVSDKGTPIGSAIVGPDGSWSVTPSAPLGNGSHTITATEKNPTTGATSTASPAVVISVDTTVPASPAIDSVIDHVGPVQKPLVDGDTTDDTKPTFTGSGAKPGDVITVSDHGTPIGSATVNPDGSWSVTRPHRSAMAQRDHRDRDEPGHGRNQLAHARHHHRSRHDDPGRSGH